MTTKYFFVYNLDGQELADSFIGPDDMSLTDATDFAKQKIADEHGPLASPGQPSTLEQVAGEIRERAVVTHIWSEKSRHKLH